MANQKTNQVKKSVSKATAGKTIAKTNDSSGKDAPKSKSLTKTLAKAAAAAAATEVGKLVANYLYNWLIPIIYVHLFHHVGQLSTLTTFAALRTEYKKVDRLSRIAVRLGEISPALSEEFDDVLDAKVEKILKEQWGILVSGTQDVEDVLLNLISMLERIELSVLLDQKLPPAPLRRHSSKI